ncbi:MAG: twin-arginine translocase TatA/TatE family subunit [candidate division WOR-3 bacterium]
MNIGFQEIILILLVTLIFMGPKGMKSLARLLGNVVHEFQKARDRVMDELEGEEDEGEPRDNDRT